MADRAGSDPPDAFVYRGRGSVPANARRAEVDRSVKFVPDRLFAHCRRLEFVLLHEEGPRRIGEQAFLHCWSLRNFRCPPTVTKIGRQAFKYCSNLASIQLPGRLREIEDSTFCGCRSLAEVRIPASAARIGNSAFKGCTNLASVDLREGLRTIGDGAFQDCRSLGSLRIPSSVDEIGEHAFDGCGSLTSAHLHEDLPTMNKFAFRGCPPESLRFVRLSERTEAIRMDERMTSMFERRLIEITRSIVRRHGNEEAATTWGKCKKSLERAHKLLNYLELKGTMPELELALWKAKIEEDGEDRVRGDLSDDEDEGRDARDTAGGIESRRDSQLYREDCRVACGSDIVSVEVRKFFAYSTSWPGLDDIE